MKKSHSFANKCISATLALSLFLSIPVTIGCGASDVANGAKTASDILANAAGIFDQVNPDVGAGLREASGDFKLLADLINEYDSAAGGQKATVADKIRALLNTVSVHFSDILASIRIKNKEKLEYANVAIAIANGVIVAILNHLPSGTKAPGPQVAPANSQSLPVIPFTSAKEAKETWNAKFPEARI